MCGVEALNKNRIQIQSENKTRPFCDKRRVMSSSEQMHTFDILLTQKHLGCFQCQYPCATHHIEQTQLHINGQYTVVLKGVNFCEGHWKQYEKCKELDESRLALSLMLSDKMTCLDELGEQFVVKYRQHYGRN